MMSIDKCPLSPALVRFQDDLQPNRCGERTQQSYVRNRRKLSEFLKRDPDSASEDEYGVRIDCSRQTSDRATNAEMPQVWRCTGLPRIRSDPSSTKQTCVRVQYRPDWSMRVACTRVDLSQDTLDRIATNPPKWGSMKQTP